VTRRLEGRRPAPPLPRASTAPRRRRRGPAPRAAWASGTSLIFAAALSLSGCGRVADFASIAKGNRLHERGLFQEAAAAYLEVPEGSFEPTVDYDLANAYARLGETSAAAELYGRARAVGDASIRADCYFNEGVALYEKSRYEEAWRAFKEALGLCLADPRVESAEFALEARRNLELSWRSWKKRSLAPPQSLGPSGRSDEGEDETELRLLRRLETGRWAPGPAKAPPDQRGDY